MDALDRHAAVERVAAAWLPTESDQGFFDQIARAARDRGRPDLGDAAETAVAGSRRRVRQRDRRVAVQRFLVRAVKSNPVSGKAWSGLKALRERRRPTSRVDPA